MDKLYVVEHQEEFEGYHLVVVFNRAFRCGYVGLPKGHEHEKKHYDDIDVDVHGGLTYSSIAHDLWAKDGYHWYLGFDCAHLEDGVDVKTMKEYGATDELINTWQHLDGEVRTKEYVLNELKNIVKQLKGE